jgi:putative (di)nucleoside polyphosphate hydrolase
MADDKYAHLPYRPCVGIALFNKAGQVFVGERIDTPGAWQMPQGGIDPGETVEQAALRELREEVGSDKADIIMTYDKKLRYRLPDRLIERLWDSQFGGQEQTWIAARFTGTDKDINLAAHTPAEFGAWKWVALPDILDLIVPFKRDTYREIIQAFRHLVIS